VVLVMMGVTVLLANPACSSKSNVVSCTAMGGSVGRMVKQLIITTSQCPRQTQTLAEMMDGRGPRQLLMYRNQKNV